MQAALHFLAMNGKHLAPNDFPDIGKRGEGGYGGLDYFPNLVGAEIF